MSDVEEQPKKKRVRRDDTEAGFEGILNGVKRTVRGDVLKVPAYRGALRLCLRGNLLSASPSVKCGRLAEHWPAIPFGAGTILLADQSPATQP